MKQRTATNDTAIEAMSILMLEDNEVDAELIHRLLKKEGMQFQFQLVMTGNDFRNALAASTPTIILADNNLPDFSALEALQHLQQQKLEIPLIMVTGSVSEEYAAGMIREGADDYILKDRPTRLPAAIRSAIRQHKARRQTQKVLEAIKTSNERFEILSRATKDAVWDWNLLTQTVWWNDNFYNWLGYDPDLSVPDIQVWSKRIHPEDVGAVVDRLRKVMTNEIEAWEDEFRFMMQDGTYGTLLDRAYVVKNAAGRPVRAIGALVDITTQKRLTEEIIANNIQQQKEITRTILQTQEMERNNLGRELHDNLNQILASVRLRLEYYLHAPDGNLDVVADCQHDLVKAIEEARNLSHKMVIPRFSEKRLHDELMRLIDNYHFGHLVELEVDHLEEAFLTPHVKETVYRVIQEQLSNIHKHANANEIGIDISNDSQALQLLIKDNGVGFDMQHKSRGIGISNIFSRIENINGTVQIISVPGDGCILKATIPLNDSTTGT